LDFTPSAQVAIAPAEPIYFSRMKSRQKFGNYRFLKKLFIEAYLIK
jgi:hypothetical protein